MAPVGPASYLFLCWTPLRWASHLQRDRAWSSLLSPRPPRRPLSLREDRTGRGRRSLQWRGAGGGPRGSPPHWPGAVGTLTGLLGEAECGQGQESEEHGGPHGASAAAAGLHLACLRQPAAPFILRAAPGGRGCLPGLFGGHPPRLCRPNPKGCCGWSHSSLGRPLGVEEEEGGSHRTQPPLGVPGPSKGATAGPPAPTHSPLEPLPQPQFELWLDSREGCGVHGKSGQSAQTGGDSHCRPWAGAKPRGRGRSCPRSPRGWQRPAGQAWPDPGQARASGRKGQGAQRREPSANSGAGPGTETAAVWGSHQAVRWGPRPRPLTGAGTTLGTRPPRTGHPA